MTLFQNISLFLTILFSGLIAGLLFGYSCSVNMGLKALPDMEYVKAMQSINTAIQNPVFFICFLGLLLLFPLTTWVFYSRPPAGSFYIWLLASSIYFIGVFGVTILGNVPLNDQLNNFRISAASPVEISAMRLSFESAWNTFHLVRTVAAILSFGLAIYSIIRKS